MKSVMDNIRKNYIFRFLIGTGFSDAIWLLYLASRGMNLVQIGILEAIFHIANMLCEVPTGYIADRFGRKTSRLLGRAAAFISSIVMISGSNFWHFALGIVFTSLSYNLESGAGDALIYDSMVECGQEDGYMKVRGRQEICYQAARLVSLIGGGLIATYSYVLAYIITAAIHLASFLFSFSFREPDVGRTQGRIKFFGHIVDSFRVVWEHKGIIKYIFYIEGFSLFWTTLFFYFQNFLKSKGYIEFQIGLVLAASAVAGLLASTVAYRIEKRLGERKLILTATPIAILLFSMIAFTNMESLALILLSGMEAILFVVFSDYINRQIPSRQRATILSFESMAFSVMMIAFFPAVGAISEHLGFKTAFTFITGLALVLMTISTILMLKDKRVEKEPEQSG
ncbi:MAG: MFS transporter [Clostridiaceae bacterium]|jgi:MFS family permease|nr:MFS transporter [Clostridiaceae bacterium]